MNVAIMDEQTQAELAAARRVLGGPGGLVVRAAEALGRALEAPGIRLLRGFGIRLDSTALTELADIALTRAFDMVLAGANMMPGPPPEASGPLVAASGFTWGLAGFAGFLPDATFTTFMILRDIARIAEAEGEDLATESGRAACVAVFSLKTGDEAGYIAARLMLEGTGARGLIARLAAGWGSVLGEKFAAQSVPIAGALAGAALNAAFLDHYRRLATAHFTIRRLRRIYGAAAVDAVTHVEDARFMEDG